MRLIDADDLIERMRRNRLHSADVAFIKSQDPVDARRVVHGNWIEKPYLFGTTRYCSLCGENYGMPHGMYNYCPNCGAKMECKE